MSDATAPAPDWYPDPSGKHQFRYWDGQQWTGHVSSDGQTAWDPPDGEAAGAAAEPTPAATDLSSAVEDQPAGDSAPQDAQAEPADQPAAVLTATQEADEQWAPQDATEADANLVAIGQAGLAPEVADWLEQVASQVDPRLTRINQSWAQHPQAEAARACAFGLLVGHLAGRHPHMRGDLSQVAEAHPSFTTLEAGSRLATLEQIAADPARAAAWLGPLIEVEDPQRIATLFD